jgi:anti-sigma factor RsiW
MSCSPIDVKDYFLKELADPDRRQMEIHLKNCPACREELERLNLTQAALFSAPEEEIPQRIAFVSDKIFEPSPWRRRLSAFWGSAAQLGFASAAMLSAAIIVLALTHPAPAPVAQMQNAPAVSRTGASAVSNADLEQRIQAAVDKAVAESEAREERKTAEAVAEIERRDREERRRLMLVADENLEYLQKRANYLSMASSEYALPAEKMGESK